MADRVHKDWRELCVAVTNERDSIQELIEALDKGERSWRHAIRPPDQSARINKPIENNVRGGLNG